MVAGKFIVLMYHNLAPVSSGRYSVAIDDFKAQLDWLKSNGYVVDGFRELGQRLSRNDFPQRYVVVSFDDGHKSNLIAADILRQFDAQGTFFLTKMVCRTKPNFMDDDEIREVARQCSVGSHGVTHLPMSRLATDEIVAELRESKQWLEEVVGHGINSFSAPGGALDDRVVHHARETGYSLIGTSVEWWNRGVEVAAHRRVNRVEVNGAFSLDKFGRVAAGSATHLLWRRLRTAVVSIPAVRSIGLRRSARQSGVPRERDAPHGGS